MKERKTVLIVDDDADDREMLKDAFTVSHEEANYITLENGDALLRYLADQLTAKPSIIVLDLNMPGKDGRETLKEIKSNSELKSIPIIVFTTSSSGQDKKVCYENGANCFITKPDTFNKLTELTNHISYLWLKNL